MTYSDRKWIIAVKQGLDLKVGLGKARLETVTYTRKSNWSHIIRPILIQQVGGAIPIPSEVSRTQFTSPIILDRQRWTFCQHRVHGSLRCS